MADAPRFDPRRLRPGELCRILNSTPLGEVTSERVLQRHRNRAGLRIDDGTGKGIDLFRYVAWLAVRRERGAKQEQAIPPGLSGYELHRERARQRCNIISPPTTEPPRRSRARGQGLVSLPELRNHPLETVPLPVRRTRHRRLLSSP